MPGGMGMPGGSPPGGGFMSACCAVPNCTHNQQKPKTTSVKAMRFLLGSASSSMLLCRVLSECLEYSQGPYISEFACMQVWVTASCTLCR